MQPAIIYEDEDIIVCKKPAGVATQTRRIGQADMESLLKNYRASKGELPYIGVVHRLDQPVEGIMVFAKNKEAAADLSRQIKTKLADKYYYAMTDGVPEKKKGTLEDELLQNGKTNTSEVVERGTPQAKHASLSYEVVEQDGKHAVLRIKLDTGRHHQIRVQMAHAGAGCSLHMQGCRSLGIKSTTSKKTLHRRADSLHCALLRSRSGIRKRIENWSLKLTSLLVYHKINPKV